jgi:hypothetical protein
MTATQNSAIVEITNTLEQIQKVNNMLEFHRSFDEVDDNAIENFERLRDDFLRQLAELMQPFHIEIKFSEAA